VLVATFYQERATRENLMLRVFSAAIAGLVLIAGVALAAEHRGYLKSVGANKLTVAVEASDKGKEKDIDIKTDAGTKFFGGANTIATTDLTKMIQEAEGNRLRVLVKTKGSGATETATEVRVAARRAKGEK